MTKLQGELGLARRGGFISFGEDLLFKLSRNRVRLVLLAADCGRRAARDIGLARQNTPVLTTVFTKEELGRLIEARPLNAIGITNSGLAEKITETLRKEGEADVEIQKQEK